MPQSQSQSQSQATLKSKPKPEPKQDVAPDLPNLDNFLTLITVSLLIATPLLVGPWFDMHVRKATLSVEAYERRVTAALEFVITFFVSAFLINTVKYLFRAVGPFLYNPTTTARKTKNLVKFADQGWQFTVHVSMTAFELYVVSANDWELWKNTKKAYNSVVSFKDPNNPTSDDSAPSRELQLLYMVQLGIWFFTAISHRFFEAHHKDYFIMYAHHVVTLALVLISYMVNQLKIGMLVLLIHDSSDIFIDLLKMTNYLGLEGPGGFFIVELSYISTIVSWAVIRLYLYPVRVIYSALVESRESCGEAPWKVMGNLPVSANNPFSSDFSSSKFRAQVDELVEHLPNDDLACWSTRVFLVILLGMHVYWYLLLVNIGVKMLAGSDPHSAGREEYEGESSDSDAVTSGNRPGNPGARTGKPHHE